MRNCGWESSLERGEGDRVLEIGCSGTLVAGIGTGLEEGRHEVCNLLERIVAGGQRCRSRTAVAAGSSLDRRTYFCWQSP